MDDSAILKQIEAYVEGKLSIEQQQSFETNLASNPAWKTAYESYLATQKALDEMALRALKNTLKETIQEKPAASSMSFYKSWYKIAAAILVLVIAGALIFNQLSTSNQQLADNAYVNPLTLFPELSPNRDTDAASKKWAEVLAEFQNSAYQNVINTLENSPNLHPAEPLLLAHAYYKNNQLGQVYTTLENYQTPKVSYQEAADWLSILALVKADKIEDARSGLTKIIQKEPISIFKKQAQELLARLEE